MWSANDWASAALTASETERRAASSRSRNAALPSVATRSTIWFLRCPVHWFQFRAPRSCLRPVWALLGRLGTFFEHLAIPDGAFAGVAGQFEVLRQLERVHRASVFAQPAEHAAGCVVDEGRQLFALGLLVALAGDHDEVLRAGQRAQVAGNAQRLAVVRVDVEPRRAAIALADFGPLGRILLRVDTLGVLVAKGHPQALEEVYEKDFPKEIQNHDRPLARSPLTFTGPPRRARYPEYQ